MRASEIEMPMRINKFSGLRAVTEVKVIEHYSKSEQLRILVRSILSKFGGLLKRGIYGGLVLTVAIVTAGVIVQGAALAYENLKDSQSASDGPITIPWRETQITETRPVQVVGRPVKTVDTMREERRYQVDMARESNRTLQTVLSSANRFASQIRR